MIPLRVLKGYLWGFKVYDLLLSIFSMTIHYLFYHCKVFDHIFESVLGTLKKIPEKPENTIISTSICFVFNSKEFESIQKDSNLESVPRFQPFLILPTLFFIFGKVKLIDSISGWSVTNLGPIHIKPEKAYGNETNWKIGFFLDLKSIIFQQKSLFTLVESMEKLFGKLG